MEPQEKQRQPAPPPAESPAEKPVGPNVPQPAEPGAPPRAWLEGLYEKLPDIPLKALDIFIGLCIAALVIVIAVGVLQSRL